MLCFLIPLLMKNHEKRMNNNLLKFLNILEKLGNLRTLVPKNVVDSVGEIGSCPTLTQIENNFISNTVSVT